MNDSLRILKASIEADEESIARLFQSIAAHEAGRFEPEDRAILLGYHLHNLYTAFENIFQRVAETFEHQVSDASQWHAQLLKRMTLNIEGVRPRLIGPEAFDCLDELRPRRLFRSAYPLRLDVERLDLALRRAHRLESLYGSELREFKAYLDRMEA